MMGVNMSSLITNEAYLILNGLIYISGKRSLVGLTLGNWFLTENMLIIGDAHVTRE